MKLAICEDNPSHYEIIHTILQKYPPGFFEITHFTSGDEFLRAIAENGCSYSIVLTDIDLGSDTVNGISLAEKINHISPDTQIIFISQDVYKRQISKRFASRPSLAGECASELDTS